MSKWKQNILKPLLIRYKNNKKKFGSRETENVDTQQC